MLKVEDVKAGRVVINGQVLVRDFVVSNNMNIALRESRASKALTERYGHTPVTTAENIPWSCQKLVIGTGFSGKLYITDEVRTRAHEMGVTLISKPTPDALNHLNEQGTNLLIHMSR